MADLMTFLPLDRASCSSSKKGSSKAVPPEPEKAKPDEINPKVNDTIEEAYDKARTLGLQVVSALALEIGAEIIIKAKGLVNGKKVGRCIYLGTESSERFPVGYLIPKAEKGIGTVHCVIQFNVEKNCYQIKDLGKGCGTFIKIAGRVTVRTGYMVFIGEMHFTITVTPEELVLKFLGNAKIKHQL
eukprot:TRINITY_DN8285_c0_g1_i1.p1 TRINITY_DN8285_c0_g1~~TRINITY_DN8285_c0_g1_i1.p1  ORF type:complete len:186 (+),score=38.14 TRINITY_DN8285_c0_g1_i1:218-775(+)